MLVEEEGSPQNDLDSCSGHLLIGSLIMISILVGMLVGSPGPVLLVKVRICRPTPPLFKKSRLHFLGLIVAQCLKRMKNQFSYIYFLRFNRSTMGKFLSIRLQK